MSNEARRHGQPLCVDLTLPGPQRLAHRGDLAVLDRNVAGPGRRAGPIDEGSIANHEVVAHTGSTPTAIDQVGPARPDPAHLSGQRDLNRFAPLVRGILCACHSIAASRPASSRFSWAAAPIWDGVSPSGAQSCWPAFPYQDGWLGGDAAYSVPLSGSDTLWLFGDTFVGSPDQVDRRGSRLVHNTIAVSRCRSGSWEIDYAWTHGPNGEPHAFLERGDEDAWWWLFDGFLHDGRLYLGLLEVERTPPRGDLSLPFAFTGVDLARVENPHDPPADWEVDVVSLTDTPRVLPASAMVIDGAYAYLFAFIDREDGAFPRGLTRLPLASLDGHPTDVGSTLERLAADGSWKSGTPDPEDMKILMGDTATEMSVRSHPDLGWLALYNFPDVAAGFPETRPSDAVWMRTAENLEGPWTGASAPVSNPRTRRRLRWRQRPQYGLLRGKTARPVLPGRTSYVHVRLQSVPGPRREPDADPEAARAKHEALPPGTRIRRSGRRPDALQQMGPNAVFFPPGPTGPESGTRTGPQPGTRNRNPSPAARSIP